MLRKLKDWYVDEEAIVAVSGIHDIVGLGQIYFQVYLRGGQSISVEGAPDDLKGLQGLRAELITKLTHRAGGCR